tara:strand:- start:132 stop:275 length:144 start_codon:yes stop_codon:yes gene_type:complete
MKRIKMQKKLKQPLFFLKYLENPHGKKTPIFTTVKPSSSLPNARKKV